MSRALIVLALLLSAALLAQPPAAHTQDPEPAARLELAAEAYFGRPNDLALAPDASSVALATQGGLYLLPIVDTPDTSSPDQTPQFDTPRRLDRAPVTHIAWTPDSRWVLAAREDGFVQVYDVASGSPRPERWPVGADRFRFRALAVAPDGSSFAVSTDMGVQVISFGLLDGPTLLETPAQHLAFLPDGRLAAYTAMASRELLVIDPATATILNRTAPEVFAIDIDTNANSIVLVGNRTQIFDTETLETTAFYIVSGSAARLLADGKLLAARPGANDPAQHVMDLVLTTGNYAVTLDGQYDSIRQLDTVPTPNTSSAAYANLAVSLSDAGDLVLWSYDETGYFPHDRSIGWHANLTAFAASPDGQRLATTPHFLSIVDLSDPALPSEALHADLNAPLEYQTGLTAFLEYVVFLDNGRIFTGGSTQRSTEFYSQQWDVNSGAATAQPFPGLDIACQNVVRGNVILHHPPTGTTLCAARLPMTDVTALRIYQPDGSTSGPLEFESNSLVTAMAFNADASRFVFSLGDGRTQVYDTASLELLQTFGFTAYHLALDDGRLYATTTDDLRVLMLDTGTEMLLSGQGLGLNGVSTMALSPDGNLLALTLRRLPGVANDYTTSVYLLDAQTLALLHTQPTQHAWFYELAFAADSSRLFGHSVFEQIVVWDVLRG